MSPTYLYRMHSSKWFGDKDILNGRGDTAIKVLIQTIVSRVISDR